MIEKRSGHSTLRFSAAPFAGFVRVVDQRPAMLSTLVKEYDFADAGRVRESAE
jgi:hypothetical protein